MLCVATYMQRVLYRERESAKYQPEKVEKSSKRAKETSFVDAFSLFFLSLRTVCKDPNNCGSLYLLCIIFFPCFRSVFTFSVSNHSIYWHLIYAIDYAKRAQPKLTEPSIAIIVAKLFAFRWNFRQCAIQCSANEIYLFNLLDS